MLNALTLLESMQLASWMVLVVLVPLVSDY